MRLLAALTLSVSATAAIAQQRSPTSYSAAFAVQVPRSLLQQYVGDWTYPDGEKVKVTLSGDTLFRETTGQRVPLVPLSQSLFRLGPVFTAEFVIDEKGGITQVLTDGVDIEYLLTRKGSKRAARPAIASAAVRIPKSTLEGYVGTYEFVPGQMSRTDLSMVVRLRGDKLTRQMTGGEEMVLTPISQTEFKVGDTSITTQFVTDNSEIRQVMGYGFQQLIVRKR